MDIKRVYKLVDTCAAEFEAQTPYFYSTFAEENESVASDRKKIVILGSGPNRIGQGIEFDYCCVHGVLAAKECGFEAIMINCNPETVSTDPDIADKLYFEPTGTCVLFIYKDRPGVIGQIGQTLADAGVNIDDMRNPHDPSGENSLALMRITGEASCEVIDKIAEQIDALHASCITF